MDVVGERMSFFFGIGYCQFSSSSSTCSIGITAVDDRANSDWLFRVVNECVRNVVIVTTESFQLT